MKIDLTKKIVTECGKRVHFVGFGICKLPVVQIYIKENDKWFLAKVIRLRTAILFGSGWRYKLINHTGETDADTKPRKGISKDIIRREQSVNIHPDKDKTASRPLKENIANILKNQQHVEAIIYDEADTYPNKKKVKR